MQNSEKNLYAFICLIRNQPSLFPDIKREELYNICVDLEDNVIILSNTVSKWCQKPSNSQIHEEFGKQRRLLFGTPGHERPPGTDEDNFPNVDIQANKEILLNAIQQSSPPNTTQPSQSEQQSSTYNIFQPPN